MLKCGLVVLNYNDSDTTIKLIEAIKNYDQLDHIAVVDNCSTDDSYKKLLKFQSDKIKILLSPKNGGYSYGNNFGIKYLIENFNPDIIGIANPDVMFNNNFIEVLKKYFELYPDYAVLTGIQLNPLGEIAGHPFWEEDSAKNILWQRFTEIFSPLTKIFNMLKYHNYRKYLTKNAQSKNEIVQVWAVEGSLFFIRALDFLNIGLFDENLFMYYEECIISRKLQKLNRKVGICPEIHYKHFHFYASDFYDYSRTRLRHKIFCSSLKYYFVNYVNPNKNKLYNKLFNLLASLENIKFEIKQAVKKLINYHQ